MSKDFFEKVTYLGGTFCDSLSVYKQGRNQVCRQRWARLENFPPKFPFWYTPNKF